MDLIDALLDSWDRQCRIVDSVASLINESNYAAKPSADGWPLSIHLAHMFRVRKYWLSQFSPAHVEGLEKLPVEDYEVPLANLDEIRAYLKASAKAVRDSVEQALRNGTGASGGYDHPTLFLQHMIWHEGWHVGLIFLGLRLAGQEPQEEWEEPNVWGQWRTE